MIERGELALPEEPVLLEPPLRLSHASGIQSTVAYPSPLDGADQPGPLQHPDVWALPSNLPYYLLYLYNFHRIGHMSDDQIPASEARKNFSDILNRVSVRGDRVVMERHGKTVAAMISMEDLALLEALEDRFDVEEARAALAESGERVSWAKLKQQLQL